MNEAALPLANRAAVLRDDFDRSFAAPAQIDATPTEDLLAIDVGAEACAIRLSEIVGLFADKKVTRVPSSVETLRGIVGFRGTMLPVYDLHRLLGHPKIDVPRWLVIVSGTPIALAFETFAGHLRIARDAILHHEGAEHTRQSVNEVVRLEDRTRRIVRLPSILESILKQKPETAPTLRS